MREEILELNSFDERVGASCRGCSDVLQAGQQIVVCPRCKSAHHLDCWIRNGGCARQGCRQVMSPQLRPHKEETPIQVRKVPRWVIWGVAALLVAIGVGVYFNAQKVSKARATSAYVLIPDYEDQALWNAFATGYNRSEAGQIHPVNITVAPTMRAMGQIATHFDQKLIIMIAANDAPEITVLEPDRFRAYMAEGALKPVTDIYAQLVSEGLAIDQDDTTITGEDGEVYGIPHPDRPAYIVIPSQPRNPEIAVEVFPAVVRYLYTKD